ncbi:MAG: ribosome biogenesis GTPase YlqF [Eubacterium sp.]
MPEYIKQNVQWFPGHMAKTRRQIKESLKLVDGVVELVDARVPMSSRNPELDSIIEKKPRIILLNKCDVADPAATSIWIKYFTDNGYYALPVDCRTGKGLNRFDAVVKQALKKTIERNESKGMSGKPLRLMVVGIPNTGKSSFINRLGKNAKAKVADKAGVTKQNQWFVVGKGIELLDTPGVLWPKFDDPEVGDKLAFIGSVKDEVTDQETLACRLLEVLAETRPSAIEERYKIAGVESLQGWEILEMIGKKRGFLIKGGEIDYERAAVIVADEFRGGRLGRITLELP